MQTQSFSQSNLRICLKREHLTFVRIIFVLSKTVFWSNEYSICNVYLITPCEIRAKKSGLYCLSLITRWFTENARQINLRHSGREIIVFSRTHLQLSLIRILFHRLEITQYNGAERTIKSCYQFEKYLFVDNDAGYRVPIVAAVSHRPTGESTELDTHVICKHSATVTRYIQVIKK